MNNRNMNTIILEAIFLVLLFVVPSYAELITVYSLPEPSTVTQNQALISLNGKKYSEEDIWLEDVASGKVKAANDETFLATVITANTKGTAVDVLNTWLPSERSDIGVYINDPTLFAASKNWYSQIVNSAPLAKVLYGEYTIFLVQHTFVDATNDLKVYPLIFFDGLYYMTNALSKDPVFFKYIPKIKEQVKYKIKLQNAK